MGKCFSFASSIDSCYRYSFERAGLKSITTNLGEGTTMHCWAPKNNKQNKPNLVLLHGIGANAMWQWDYFISPLIPKFNVYVPDLVFFGESYTTRSERTESFQAQCVMKMMEKLGVKKMSVCGVSYGGFVAYSMTAQFADAIEKLVLVCSGICLEEKDMEDGMFKVSNLDDAADILLPQTPAKLKELLKFAFYKPNKFVPSCFLQDFIQVLCAEHREERKQLIQALHKDRKLANLPKINQNTLIIWGEHDQIFPTELAHRLKRHIGDSAKLVFIKKAGHALNIEKPKAMYKEMKAFLLNADVKPQSNGNTK
ncbi:uncharacterized protein LOC130807792 [Amaranthus tricolor]|uniref:uncharacterized protein LOC130807792 n=1 Tax=Amaranthus tricolor TaxID=29722 RepID=UPI00258D3D05|nr:uncharacterized protein LOC130807792 [Amaranthus tricolor]